MTEYGLFNDEGLVEGQFYSEAEAAAARAELYDPEDDLTVAEVCPEHPEQVQYACEEDHG